MSSHLIRSVGESRKRKEREAGAESPRSHVPAEAWSNDRLLAGYLAHQYITKGRLFGQRWDPAAVLGDSKKAARAEEASQPKSYGDVARLLKTDAAHIPGVVNPTDLAQWLRS